MSGGIYAKVKKHMSTHPSQKRYWYSLEFKVVAIGEESRWPCQDMARFDSSDEAKEAAKKRGWKVVKNWRDAYDDAQIGPWDGVYRAYEPSKLVTGPAYTEERFDAC